MKYEAPNAGEWVQPVKRGYKLACCDCGLVHTLNFRIVSKKTGKLVADAVPQFQAFRHKRSTAMMRRWKKRSAAKATGSQS